MAQGKKENIQASPAKVKDQGITKRTRFRKLLNRRQNSIQSESGVGKNVRTCVSVCFISSTSCVRIYSLYINMCVSMFLSVLLVGESESWFGSLSAVCMHMSVY